MANILVAFLTHYPPTYDPGTQRVQWMDQIPNPVRKDPNFVFIMARGENTAAEMIAKGMTHFKRADLHHTGWTDQQVVALRDQGVGYDDVPQTPSLFFLGNSGPGGWTSPPGIPTVWPWIWWRPFWNTPDGATEPMSAADGADRGRRYHVEFPVAAYETQENIHAISSHWACVREWVAAWVPRQIARWPGKVVICIWNYYDTLGHTIRYGNATDKKALLHKPLSQWPASPYLPGGNLAPFTAMPIPIYLGAPDDVAHIGYDIQYQAGVNKKAGKLSVVFEQPAHEYLPNNKKLWRVPGGKHYAQNKLAIGAGLGYTIHLFSRIFTNGMIGFGLGGKSTKPFKLDPQWHTEGIFVPDGNGETEPGNLAASPVWGPYGNTQEVFASGGQEDYAGFAQWVWERSYGYVIGGTNLYCDLRVDGGSWKIATNSEMDDVVDAYYGDGYQVHSRRLGNKVAFMVYNGKMQDAQRHKVEWRFSGLTFEGWISGTIPYVYLHTL